MPFQKQVSDEEILEQFDRQDLERNAYTYTEIAEDVDSVTAEAVRQRLKKMDGEKVGSVEIGGVRLWHKNGVEVFADGGAGSVYPVNLEEDIGRFYGDAGKLAVVAISVGFSTILLGAMAIEFLGSLFGVPYTLRVSFGIMFGIFVGLVFHYRSNWLPFVGKFNPMVVDNE